MSPLFFFSPPACLATEFSHLEAGEALRFHMFGEAEKNMGNWDFGKDSLTFHHQKKVTNSTTVCWQPLFFLPRLII